MAHFAKIENNVVVDLIVIGNEDCGGGDFPDSEPLGQSFIERIALNDPRLVGEWKQTSYNNNFRAVFGNVGFIFDPSLGEHGEFLVPEGFFPEPEAIDLSAEGL
jgi:hypothetical protein